MQHIDTITNSENTVIVSYFLPCKIGRNADIVGRRAILGSTVACSRVKFGIQINKGEN